MRIPRAAVRRIASGRSVALASALCIAAGLGFGTARGPVLWLSIAPAFAFDGTTTPSTAALTPSDGLRSNTNHPLDEKAKALTALQYAADQGQPAAQWKLGRMYADGDGVPQDQMRAFNYFSEIANTHPDESRTRRGPASSTPMRPPISAMPMRNTSLGGSFSTRRRRIRTRRRVGSSWPPTRVNAAPRRRSAIFCSRANMCRGKPHAA
jgi:TPR repeat protein